MHNQELGEYLGVESCIDFKPDVAAIASRGGAGCFRPRRSRRSNAAEYPPPIPLLAHIENLAPHVPWVMKKHRTSDGRLVITEERAPRHQYFQVHRSDGRLVLNLIPADDEDDQEEGRGGGGGEVKLGLPGNVEASSEEIGGRYKRIGGPPPEGVYIGVESCGGFGVAMAGIRPPASYLKNIIRSLKNIGKNYWNVL